MKVNFDPIYRGEALFQEASYPHLESYAEVYRTAIGDAGDQLAANGEGLKKKHTRVIDLNEELCDLLNEIKETEFSLKEFEGLEGKNIYDDVFIKGSHKTSKKVVDLKKSWAKCRNVSIMAVVSVIGAIALIPLAFVSIGVAVGVIASVIFGSMYIYSLVSFLPYDVDFKEKKAYFKENGYMDKHGNAIDFSENPVKLKLEESLVDLRAKLAEKETQVKKAEREFSETLSSASQIVNQKGIIEEKFQESFFLNTSFNNETVAQMTENGEALEELEKAERYLKTLQEKGVIPKQLCTVPEVVTAVTEGLSQLVA